MKELTIFFFLLFSNLLIAQVITIGDTGDFLTLEDAESSINAGDSVILQSQLFDDGSQFLSELHGSSSEPIVIIAETEHGAIFQGGSEAIHLINCTYVELNGIIFEQQSANGVNIDDGGDYSTPSAHITIRNCIFREMAASGNNDLLKMSGVDSFLIEKCDFINGGSGGSGIDFVGCHWGTVQDCYFNNAGTTGIQNKGGSQFIRIQRNIFKDLGQRALNLGGNTDLQYFRPPLPNPIVDAFEAADLDVFSNIFIGSWSPIAYVGSVRVKVYNNTIYKPENWVIRILQETTVPGFLPCSDNEFRNNIVYLEADLTEVNVGGNTAAETFIFTNNLWFNESSSSWQPNLPVVDSNQVIDDPLFFDDLNEDFTLLSTSPAIEAGKVLDQPNTDFGKYLFTDPPSSGAHEGSQTTLAISNYGSFQAKEISDYIKLSWSMVSNYDNEGFEIQRSKNGIDWQNIGWVNSADQSIINNKYHFWDKAPLFGNNYYRYKQRDTNGHFNYSKTIIIHFEKPTFVIYPNPSSKSISIKLNSKENAKRLSFYDQLGKLVLKRPFNSGQIDISSFEKGIYIVEIEFEFKTTRQRLIIQ